MRVLLFGASGMIGQGVLRECLRDPEVTQVVAILRRPSGQTHPKLKEVLHQDYLDYAAIEKELAGLEACFFCLGVTSAGLDEAAYLFRPGVIQPLHGITSRTRLYRVLYTLFTPFFPLLKRFAPDSFTTTEQLGLAMVHAALRGAPQAVLETADINRL